MQDRMHDLVREFTAEVQAMRGRLEQMARQVDAAIARIETQKAQTPPPAAVPWGFDASSYLERRQQVGLGTRCPLADLFTNLKERHAELTIREFHTGLKQLQLAKAVALLPSSGPGDNPGPEYALLDGANVYYYVARIHADP
jgi:hypothetical protein